LTIRRAPLALQAAREVRIEHRGCIATAAAAVRPIERRRRVASSHKQSTGRRTSQPVLSGMTTVLVRALPHNAAYAGCPLDRRPVRPPREDTGSHVERAAKLRALRQTR
jgi:hypothetical protein